MTILQLNELKDGNGLRPSDWEDIAAGSKEYDREQRRRAMRALWRPPVIELMRQKEVPLYRNNRGDDWTLLRAIMASFAILLKRYWTDQLEQRRRAKKCEVCMGLDMAYWDNRPVYGGYTVDVLQLYPGFHISIFNDGETNL